MSGLAAFALGLCAQQALLGKTWAGASVYLEPASPIESTTPAIAICNSLSAIFMQTNAFPARKTTIRIFTINRRA